MRSTKNNFKFEFYMTNAALVITVRFVQKRGNDVITLEIANPRI